MGKLTKAQITTLREMLEYDCYTLRQATCRWLVALGLASVVSEPSAKKRPAGYRITEAGRRALRETPDA